MSVETPKPLAKHDGKMSLSEIFNHEVQRAMEDYPQLKGRFAFVNTADREAYWDIHPDNNRFRSDEDLQRYLEEAAYHGQKMGAHSMKDPRTGLNLLVYAPIPVKLFTKKGDPAEIEALTIFDHELGHLVVKGGMRSQDPCMNECAADAFAMIRHMQRYGVDTDIINIGSWNRAFNFAINGDPTHFTAPVLDALDKLKDQVDFASLTANQIKDLAYRIAQESTPHPDTVYTTAMHFKPIYEIMSYSRGKEINRALEMLADLTLKYKDDRYTFLIGYSVLMPLLDGQVRLEGFDVSSPKWAAVRAEMKTHEAAWAADGVLAGLPKKEKKPVAQDFKDSAEKKASPPPASFIPPFRRPSFGLAA